MYIPKDGGNRVSKGHTVSYSKLFPVVLMDRTLQREPADSSGRNTYQSPLYLGCHTLQVLISTEALWRQAQEARCLGGADARLQKALHITP